MEVRHKVHIDEHELIKGCLACEEKYFKILYNNYYGKMLNVCMRYARDRDEAKDVLQDGFIKVFKSINQFDFKGSFEGWIRRIIVNTAINHYRKNTLRNITDYVDDEDLQKFEREKASIDIDTVAYKVEPEILLKLVQQLPSVYKMVFNLYVMEEHSHKEIAQMLDITESTSRSNLTKAKIKLKMAVEELLNKEKIQYAAQ